MLHKSCKSSLIHEIPMTSYVATYLLNFLRSYLISYNPKIVLKFCVHYAIRKPSMYMVELCPNVHLSYVIIILHISHNIICMIYHIMSSSYLCCTLVAT